MRDHLSELAMLGITSMTERNEGRRGETYREYALDLDPELILHAMEDTVEVVVFMTPPSIWSLLPTRLTSRSVPLCSPR